MKNLRAVPSALTPMVNLFVLPLLRRLIRPVVSSGPNSITLSLALLGTGLMLVRPCAGGGIEYLTSAELYHAASGSWSVTGDMSTAREGDRKSTRLNSSHEWISR